MNNKYLKARGKFFKSIPISDWQTILDFERIVKNYLKMRELLKEQMEELTDGSTNSFISEGEDKPLEQAYLIPCGGVYRIEQKAKH